MSRACNFCGKSFAHTASRIRHVREQHGSLRTTCSRCGNAFSRASYFKVHNCKGYCENSNNTHMETDDNEKENYSVKKDIFGEIIKDEQGYTKDDDEGITKQTDSETCTEDEKYDANSETCTEDEEYDTENSSDTDADSIEGETDEENTGDDETEYSNPENTADEETGNSNEETTEDDGSEYSSDNGTEKYSSNGNSVNEDLQRYTSGDFVTDSLPRAKYNSFQGGRYVTDLLNTKMSYEKQGQNIERLILRMGNDCRVILETGDY